MNFNWGKGIAIFYSLFVIVMITMVIKSTYHKAQLVQENYYDKDLNYEEFRKKRQNGAMLKDKIIVDFSENDKNITISFPNDMTKAFGAVTLYRPSDKLMDKTYNLSLNHNGQMNIPINNNMVAGLWKIQIDWENKGQKYFNEESIIL